MTQWHTNLGNKPTRGPDAPEGAPPILRVYVRLRNGSEPKESWPVDTGRADTTRWTKIGHDFDIMEWREA